MIFKQKVLKEEILKLILSLINIAVPFIVIGVWVIINEDSIMPFLVFTLVLFLPTFLLALLLSLAQLEWYYIYMDRIEAKNIFGIKNTVYFDDVLFIEKTRIPLTTRGMYKTFFVFHDGRRNNGNILYNNSCYNHKKYNFRIYMTLELEQYIVSTLRLNIKEGY